MLYECVVCGRAWASKQSLRAHMRVHRREGYMRTGIQVRRDQWEPFKALCKRHKTTTCHLLGALIDAALKGDELGVVTVGAPNPAVIQVTHNFIGAPRSKWKFPLPVPFVGRVPVCESAYRVHAQNGTIACSRWGRGVSAAECERCPWLRGWTEVR